MKKIGLILFVLGLLWGGCQLWLKPYTGYMDADYYFTVARNLYAGRGFQDYLLWNYLVDPVKLPIPAASYWMPAASVIAYLGMLILKQDTLIASRILFIILFALAAPITAYVSWNIYRNKLYAIVSGSLVLVSGYYLKFISVPDGFAILFLCGAAIILLIQKRNEISTAVLTVGLGFTCGIIHMTRADGFVWFLLTVVLLVYHLVTHKQKTASISIWKGLSYFVLFTGSYLLISGWWYLRNWQFYQSLMPPGGIKGLWLTNYEDLFLYPAQGITIERWLALGWGEIVLTRVKAIGINLVSFITVGGLLFLIPGLLSGFKSITDRLQRNYWIAGFAIIFLIMSVFFPYAGIRGGFLHSMATIQPFLWVILPAGISRLIRSISEQKNLALYSEVKILSGILFIASIVSLYLIINERYQSPTITQANLWQEYAEAEEYIQDYGVDSEQGVIVANPAAYYAVTLRPAVMIPTGEPELILDLANKFQAEYIIFTKDLPIAYVPLFEAISNGDIPAREIGITGTMMIFHLGLN